MKLGAGKEVGKETSGFLGIPQRHGFCYNALRQLWSHLSYLSPPSRLLERAIWLYYAEFVQEQSAALGCGTCAHMYRINHRSVPRVRQRRRKFDDDRFFRRWFM
ncbi:hypothetical protein Y032_0742g1985 [Ancylostoma ceylanicum]|uniref:Uncharacterized protein n=1 Tax=Ancylostoma ceylanicum TaxID=53326 RepID=A0A016WGJ2_9BILA|nr:hypothetical protein Y032_0742g1985 [Ancylostoma ceylanicum]